MCPQDTLQSRHQRRLRRLSPLPIPIHAALSVPRSLAQGNGQGRNGRNLLGGRGIGWGWSRQQAGPGEAERRCTAWSGAWGEAAAVTALLAQRVRAVGCRYGLDLRLPFSNQVRISFRRAENCSHNERTSSNRSPENRVQGERRTPVRLPRAKREIQPAKPFRRACAAGNLAGPTSLDICGDGTESAKGSGVRSAGQGCACRHIGKRIFAIRQDCFLLPVSGGQLTISACRGGGSLGSTSSPTDRTSWVIISPLP